ncbi:YdcF family protein [Pseudomonas sp. dw_358]|uniref:YdcF family protein n=1 Tax=Pseudomonas sp. dw_358 TaxID=2720083 RepID=UPI001BD52E5E|nr:YdcF family protein [Pseudomonas sp. dw_358]
MFLRYIIKQLLLPPGILFIFLLLAWWLRRARPRLAGCLFVLGLGGLWLMSLPVVVKTAAHALESVPPLPMDQWAGLAGKADAIVVLGAGRDRDDIAWGGTDQPSALAFDRIRYASRIAKASGLPVLISGGLDYDRPPSEAAMMADSMEHDFGVKVRWQEGESRTTWENARFTAAMLDKEGIKRIVLVTHGWHMPRSLWSFQQAGFTVIPAPMGFLGGKSDGPVGGWLPEPKSVWQNGWLMNEAVGAVGYRLFYRH